MWRRQLDRAKRVAHDDVSIASTHISRPRATRSSRSPAPDRASPCPTYNDVFNFVPFPGAPSTVIDAYVKQSVFPGCFANGLPTREATELAATQRPLATNALTDPSGPPAWATIPSWDVAGTADHVIPLADQLSMAHNAGAHITEIDAPHLSMIADPRAVTSVIEQAADRTGKSGRDIRDDVGAGGRSAPRSRTRSSR
jgi:pimeloyl-ACP methyl ester carboxylesterase